MRHRLLTIIGALAVAAALTATAALGSNLTATANVSGTAGISLSLPSNPSFSDTLSGADQIVSYAPVLGVVDATGTGAGWSLSMSATSFDDGASHTFAPGSVSSVAQACHSGSSCTAASPSGLSYPIAVSTTAAKIFNAAANSGMGKIDVTPTVQVTVPGNAYAGTYTSTVTLATATGP